MHSKFGLFQMSSLSLCAALSKVNFVVYYIYKKVGILYISQYADQRCCSEDQNLSAVGGLF